jgi:hypothetical protein
MLTLLRMESIKVRRNHSHHISHSHSSIDVKDGNIGSIIVDHYSQFYPTVGLAYPGSRVKATFGLPPPPRHRHP